MITTNKNEENKIKNSVCDFVIIATGVKENLDEFYRILNNDYNDRHMFCIYRNSLEKFETLEDEKNNIYTYNISGKCQLSIYACMIPAKGTHYYYNTLLAMSVANKINSPVRVEDYKNCQLATNIIEISRVLKLNIKLWGYNEDNDNLMEWYIINDGIITDNWLTGEYRLF